MNPRKMSMWVLAAAVTTALAGGEALADGKKGTAVIKGMCKFTGDKPKLMGVNMSADPNCKHDKPVPNPELIVGKDGELPFVFVHIKSGISEKYDAPKEPAHIDQNGCMYDPHVFGMIAGQALKITNSDDTAHNIHAAPKINNEFNFGQPKKGMVTVREGKDTFKQPEVMIHIKCDVHPWMSAYVGVVTHPFFAVSSNEKDNRGKFEIKELPAGSYELEAWHEKWGTVTQKVEIKDGETKEINFEFTKPGGGAKAAADRPAPRTVTLSTIGSGEATAAPAACCEHEPTK